MAGTNSLKGAKDGTGASFNLTMVSEGVSANIAQKTYVGSPSTEGLIEPAQDGVDVTAAVQLTGGVGIRGWLSGCYTRLSSILTAIGTPIQATGGTVGLVAGSALVGKAGIDQTVFGSSNAVCIPPSSSGTIALAPVVTAAFAASLVVKASPGNLYDFYVTTGSTAGILMIFDATSAPGDGAVTPKIVLQCPALTTTALTRNPPSVFTTGITMVFSSNTANLFTKTASATVFMSGRAA